MKYIIGARGSQLSIAQTNWVISELRHAHSDIDFEIKPIKTQGDTDARPLFTIDQKGIFEKEIDRAVSEGQVDFAVHSLKDVPSQLDSSLTLACIPKRELVNDVFISFDGSTLENIKPGSTIGTSSLRRAVQISRKRPDVKVKPIRGNIETRIKKVSGENYDAIVLAQAGISRLGIDVSFTPLSIEDFSPSPGQGALAIVARKNDEKTIQMLKKIEDFDSRLEIEAERALSDFVDSGCRFPVGAYAKSNDTEMSIKVNAFSVDGKQSLYVTKTGNKNDPYSLGKSAGEELRQKGVNDLALNWREKVEEWNKQ
ncbi:hydroxymethylbilane synthase [Nitrosopumilus sp. K4]|uniref:hydroxymethylbilane synthase n=1 Tax=Nitrosopumilus sp. K4 TaxID=2795383 RepID=UPI001BA441E3|nr:hydroxymethylbilane synthase [Nitrosopumilus sp. K4]QUC64003.1 hydroxymethylbilane synthase [Nitrosopumilus sp. K4]